ncbi:MAG TPA: FAD-binding oxidoreductase [Spirochaetia bacterium]|nr:FAD-binding oxidoreductase [Spirochaetia bacterium]
MKTDVVAPHTTRIRDRTWLSEKAFQVALDRPGGFRFLPGQSIRIAKGSAERDYSLACAPDSELLTLCVRHVPRGILSTFLAEAPLGTSLTFTGPHGYFLFQDSAQPPVLVAAGVGVAPFLSMVGAGVTGFTLLHGARTANELYYESLLRAASALYVPCLSEGSAPGCFIGRVSDWARERLSPRAYDFYLCGSREMIRDVTRLVDERFPGSLVHTEIFH